MKWLTRLNPFRKRGPSAQELVQFAANWEAGMQRMQRGTYDAAQTPADLENYWANTDNFDADSANSPNVRDTLRSRSRYEMANNGYADGIAQTYSTDLVGVGPQLRMQTGSPKFNEMVELSWFLWCRAAKFRRKLWCMAHAKHGDGEGMGVLRVNKRLKHPIPLDIVLYESEEFASPYLSFDGEGIDGIPKFDEFGNPTFYERRLKHPGSTNGIGFGNDTELIPADRVLHWFKMRRPGQHRGVPECASTLNLGAIFRRGRNAQISTWEKIASWVVFLKTMFEPETAHAVTPLSAHNISHNMMTALPNSVEPVQLKSEQPGANYPEAHKLWLSEQARPKCMSYNKAACDSSGSNYSSGRLDFLPYYAMLDVDREDCNESVLDPTFEAWFDWAILIFGWLGGNPEAVGPGARVHTWDWPKHSAADVEAEANANRTKLESGQTFLPLVYVESGLDFEDELTKAATAYGITPDELRKRILDAQFPPAQQPLAAPNQGAIDKAVESTLRTLERRGSIPKANGNGVHIGN